MSVYQEAAETLETIRDFLRWGYSQCQRHSIVCGHGYIDPWDEIVALLSFVLQLPVDMDERVLDARLLASEKQQLLILLEKRVIERIPVAYLTQQAWFAGLSFYIDERVLIPRSPIAELIENQCQPWIAAEKVSTILDMCTGSACIAIACAQYFPDANIDAVDISADALIVAEKNVQRHACAEHINLIQSDLFAGIAGKKYDIIIANPPYVSEEELASLPAEYTHEPRLALHAADDGLQCVMQLLWQADRHLNENGILIVEVGNAQYPLKTRYPMVPFCWLAFERGGEGIFLLKKSDVKAYFHDGK